MELGEEFQDLREGRVKMDGRFFKEALCLQGSWKHTQGSWKRLPQLDLGTPFHYLCMSWHLKSTQGSLV